jgi:hypothetical protein
MVLRIFFLKLTFSCFVLLSLNAQNFEGIIIYERTTTEGKLALETYYFGDQKLRIDSRYLFADYHRDYISIFDFENYTNEYFSSSGDLSFRSIEISKNSILEMNVFPDSISTILGYDCYLVETELETGMYSAIMNQSRCHARDLKFSVPEEWMLDYKNIISGDNNIALFWEGTMSTLDPELVIYFDPNRRFTYRAIKVIPMKLPDDLFDYEALLAENK